MGVCGDRALASDRAVDHVCIVQPSRGKVWRFLAATRRCGYLDLLHWTLVAFIVGGLELGQRVSIAEEQQHPTLERTYVVVGVALCVLDCVDPDGNTSFTFLPRRNRHQVEMNP